MYSSSAWPTILTKPFASFIVDMDSDMMEAMFCAKA